MTEKVNEDTSAAEKESHTDRRNFLKGTAAAGLLGVTGNETALLNPADAQQATVEDPKAPAGLGPRAIPDARFPFTYETSVPEGVRVLAQYFAALSRRDLKGMAEVLHFPFGSYEGTEVIVVNTPEDLMAHAPPSMNMSENPERFTDHDGYLKPGAYDVFEGIEVLNADPMRVNLSLTYNRYGSEGKKLLRCEGIYCATNNDGKWGLQLMSTIFTPANMIGLIYRDTIEAAKRLRINHDLAYMVDDEEGVWGRVRQYGRVAGVSEGAGRGHTIWEDAPDGKAMDHFRIKGVTNRLIVSDVTPESLSKMHIDFPGYRALFPKAGVGNWGFAIAMPPGTRVVHATVDKAHMYSGVARYTTAGEFISNSIEVSIITYKKGRWGWAGSLAYITTHDRANDIHV